LAEIPATKKSGRISAAKAENPTVPNQLVSRFALSIAKKRICAEIQT